VAPVILLDDVLSELDPLRRAQLLALLATPARNQVLVTTTEPFSGVTGFHDVLYHSVRAGVITEDVGP
jgi:recombinational DNA repair ATPase RecF